MEFDVMPLFAIPIYISQINLTDEMYKKVRSVKFRRLDVDNGDVSINTRILDDVDFQDIKEEIDKHIKTFTKDALHVSDHINFEVTNSWVMRHTKGDFADAHIHVNSIFSGILYIDVDENSGDLKFEKDQNYSNLFPPAIDVPVDKHNVYNSKSWTFTPNPGSIFMFPSNLIHSVTESFSDITRHCVAFNVFPKGTLGLEHPSPLSVLNLK